MNLESKHLIPYLPYSLKVRMEGKKTNVAWMSTKNIAVIRPLGIGDIKKIKWEYAHLNIKPILRPLSDLTKVIKHNGKEIKPLDIILEHHEFYDKIKLIQFDEDIFIELKGHSMLTEMYSIDNSPLQIAEKLFEWHFDVFDLIEKGLAVNVNNVSLAEC